MKLTAQPMGRATRLRYTTPMRRLAALALFLQLPLAAEPAAGRAADLARASREAAFDRGECYRVRDLSLVKEDIRIYLTDGH